MRLAWLPIFALLVAAEPRKLPEPYQSFADLAGSVPPEFGAEALLRLAESGKIRDHDARRDLVEQAFRLGGMAKLPVRMRGVAGTMVDTRSGFLSKSYDLKLDALSLQTRAVRDMVPLDATKARALFLEIRRQSRSPLTCDDALVYDVADYYQALGVIVQSTFTPQERKKEDDLKFLMDYLGQVSSALELAPAARLVKGSGMSGNEQDVLATRFSGLLESIQPDDRSFAASLEDIRREITPAMQASFDKYKQKSEGCRDDSRPGITLQLSQGPVQAGNTPSLTRYWESGAAKQMLQDGLKLRFTNDGKMLSEAARTSREWQQQLLDYLNRLADWTAGQEKSEAVSCTKACWISFLRDRSATKPCRHSPTLSVHRIFSSKRRWSGSCKRSRCWIASGIPMESLPNCWMLIRTPEIRCWRCWSPKKRYLAHKCRPG